MIREYERGLNSEEQQIIEGLVKSNRARSLKTKGYLVILVLAVCFSWFILWFTDFDYLPVSIVVIVVTLFIGYQVYAEIADLFNSPKHLKQILKNGEVHVTELKVDRFLKIENKEGNSEYFVIEHKGNLNLIKPDDLDLRNGVSSLTEKIDILNGDKTYVFHSMIKCSGDRLEPYAVINYELAKEIFGTDLWEALIRNNPVNRKLEDFEVNIREKVSTNKQR
jgi:hypothetical protein